MTTVTSQTPDSYDYPNSAVNTMIKAARDETSKNYEDAVRLAISNMNSELLVFVSRKRHPHHQPRFQGVEHMKCPFKKGSIVTSKSNGSAYRIIDDEGTATRTINVSNKDEWELFSEPIDETPLVEGGQRRTGKQLTHDAVLFAMCAIGAALLLAWAVWSVM